MVGAFAVSISTIWSSHPLPFALFLAGHVIWSVIAYHMDEKPLLAMNAMYLGFDLWAVFVRIQAS
jgi:hypothetical protein